VAVGVVAVCFLDDAVLVRQCQDVLLRVLVDVVPDVDEAGHADDADRAVRRRVGV
jgi:hypothetical protein